MIRLFIALVTFAVISSLARAGAVDDAKQCERSSGIEAIQLCTKAIRSGDLSTEEQANSYINRGIKFNAMGDRARAIDDFSRALSMKPFLVETLLARGALYLATGSRHLAYTDFGLAIRIDPNDARGYLARGLLILSDGNAELALSDISEAVRLAPNDPSAFKYRALIFLSKRQYELAISDLKTVICLTPDDAEAVLHLAKALNNQAWSLVRAGAASQDNANKAVSLALEAVALFNGAETLETLAASYAAAGRFDDAVATQERMIELLRAAGNPVEAAESRLELYRDGQAYRE